MKTIYNTYVVMESQEQCDRMKQLCLDNDLDIWNNDCAFDFCESFKYFSFKPNSFWISSNIWNKEQITEEEFKELLKTK